MSLILRRIALAADRGLRVASSNRRYDASNSVGELVGFLPVLQYDGSSMRQLDAEAILDIATSGTSATLLAKRWESVLLVNVDDSTLNRLMKDDAAMAAFRQSKGSGTSTPTLRNDHQSVRTNQRRQTPCSRWRRTQHERKERNRPKQKKAQELAQAECREKLISLARVSPVFMYLTDYPRAATKRCHHEVGAKALQKSHWLDDRGF